MDPISQQPLVLIILMFLMDQDICQVTGVKRKGDVKRTILISLLTPFSCFCSWDIAVDLGLLFQTKCGRLWRVSYT